MKIKNKQPQNHLSTEKLSQELSPPLPYRINYKLIKLRPIAPGFP